jgi:hypothetical protein
MICLDHGRTRRSTVNRSCVSDCPEEISSSTFKRRRKWPGTLAQQINGGALTTVPGEPVAVPDAPAAGGSGPFMRTFGDQQHFVYIDNSEIGNLQDCWYDDATSGWHLQQINNGTKTTVLCEPVAVPDAPAAAGSGRPSPRSPRYPPAARPERTQA